ncbi:MAG TPA: hypothetical protein GX503_05090 [Clostridiales bacterium]|nr:hypothetical protein [Clostridiales bacterium]
MFIELMRGIGIFYYWTWFVWPFVFLFSFVLGLSAVIKDEEGAGKNILWAAISLLIILAGIAMPHIQ